MIVYGDCVILYEISCQLQIFKLNFCIYAPHKILNSQKNSYKFNIFAIDKM